MTALAALEYCMEREANYAAVGAFVLLVIALATAVVFWYSDAPFLDKY